MANTLSSICKTHDAALHWHGTLGMRASYPRRLLAMSGNDAHALIELLCDVLRSTGFQERNATGAARLEDPLPGCLHVWWVRLTGHLLIAQGEPQVAWSHFGKAKARHA